MLDDRVTAFDAEFVCQARMDEVARRRLTMPGIGTINATALVAAVGDGTAFARGRDMAAWLGLAPRQRMTGGKPKRLCLSKRGHRYPRQSLIHGAWAVLPYLAARTTPLGRWVQGSLARPQEHGAGGARQRAGAPRLGATRPRSQFAAEHIAAA